MPEFSTQFYENIMGTFTKLSCQTILEIIENNMAYKLFRITAFLPCILL